MAGYSKTVFGFSLQKKLDLAEQGSYDKIMCMDKKNKNEQIANIYDKFFWDIYGRPNNVVGFFKDFLPSNILNALDLSYISVDKKSYLSEEYKDQYSDLVVETRFKANAEEPVFVYFLLEHKSYIPTRPAFQLLRYMVEQWYELEKKGALGSKLPPIFPILIYHGEKGWSPGVHFHDIVNIPHKEMLPYIPNFQYFLSNAKATDENLFESSVVIKCWYIVVKNLKDPAMREKLTDVVKLIHDRLEQDTALEYLDIFMKFLANTDNRVTRADAVKAIETIFPERGAAMIQGWAKEYVEEGMQEGLKKGLEKGLEKGIETGLEKGLREGMVSNAREMVLEALDIRFSNKVPMDIQQIISALTNKILLKKLLRSALQTKDIDEFRKIIQKLPTESKS